MEVQLVAGVTTGVGSLPHTDPAAAADVVLELLPDLPALPTLPRRSPREGMLAQALVGVRGVRIGVDGEVEVRADRLDPQAPVCADLDHDAFAGYRAFLAAARGRRAPVKWQLTGPVTLGLALSRRGVPAEVAFGVAVAAVRGHLVAIHHAVAAALPGCAQVVFLDEPGITALLSPGFPLPPDDAIDLISGSLATIEPVAMTGLHHCGSGDWAALLSSGPAILSLPVHRNLVDVAGYLGAFLDGGGWIAWGAVPTDRPVGSGADRHWRELADVWCELVQAGCNPIKLRSQAIVTPACGLALHSEEQAERVLRLTSELAERVRAQAVATRLSIGA